MQVEDHFERAAVQDRSCRADCARRCPARFDSRVGWLRPRTIGTASHIGRHGFGATERRTTHGRETTDSPLTGIAAPALLRLAALVAGSVPARRAGPKIALGYE